VYVARVGFLVWVVKKRTTCKKKANGTKLAVGAAKR